MSVAAVAEAVRVGSFVDYPERPGFYTNHEISDRALEVHLAGEGVG